MMKQLARLRQLKGFSQRALAKESGVAPATIYELENGRRKPNPSTLRKLASALGVEVAELLEAEHPKDQEPPSLQPSFNGLLEEERRSRYLRSWRAFVWKLVRRWEEDPPKTGREIAVVLDTMQALIDEGAFAQPPERITTSDAREASEWLDLSFVFRGIQRLNEIADTVEEDRTAQQRRELLKALPGGLSA
jgi:transcriptional regulator with XRE-family HTH domain